MNFRADTLPRGGLTRVSHISALGYHFTDEKSSKIPCQNLALSPTMSYSMGRMKIKQTKLLVAIGVVMAASFCSALVASTPSQALTQQEKKECYERWAGLTTGTAGDGQKYDPKKFEKSKCYIEKGGSCSIARYSDGSSIYCQRKDGKYDNQEQNGTWTKTTGGFSTPPQGDNAPNTPNPQPDEDQGGSGEGAECATAVLPASLCADDGSGIMGLLGLIVSILAAGVGIVAVGGLVYAAILYTSAADDAAQTKKAKDMIANVVIGIVAFALMWAFLQFIIPGGVFG